MLDKVYELNEDFEINGKVRLVVYAAALMLNILNCRVLLCMPHGGTRVCMLIATALLTALIYFISGGIAGCYLIVKAGAKIIDVMFILVVLFCPFVAPLLMIFSTVFSLIGCAYFAYVLPIIFVPIAGLVRRKLCTNDNVSA